MEKNEKKPRKTPFRPSKEGKRMIVLALKDFENKVKDAPENPLVDKAAHQAEIKALIAHFSG